MPSTLASVPQKMGAQCSGAIMGRQAKIISNRLSINVRPHQLKPRGGYPQNLWITLWMRLCGGLADRCAFAELSNWSNFRHPIFTLWIRCLRAPPQASRAKASSTLDSRQAVPAVCITQPAYSVESVITSPFLRITSRTCIACGTNATATPRARLRRGLRRRREKNFLQIVQKAIAQLSGTPAVHRWR